MAFNDSFGAGGGWLKPRGEEEGLRRYVDTVRERWKLVLACVIGAGLAAGLYVALAPRVYEATAELLVTPVPRDDAALSTLPLIRDSSDPTRDVETAAKLVVSTDVARAVIREMGLDTDPETLLEDIEAAPVAQSNIVSLKVRADDAVAARNLANTVAEATIEDRTQQLHAVLDDAIAGLRAQRDTTDPNNVAALEQINTQLARMFTLRGGVDPTIRVETKALVPRAAASPKPRLAIAGGLFAGLLLGIGAAFASQALDPRLRREEQLRALFDLPILARMPRERVSTPDPIHPTALSAGTREGYRTLRATLAAAGREQHRGAGGRAVLVAGAGASEGKTTTALNLAAAMAHAGDDVILIDADVRRPKVADALAAQHTLGIGAVLLGDARLEEALIDLDVGGAAIRALLPERRGMIGPERLALPTATEMIEEARSLADFVIVDAPPLPEVGDALPLARAVDQVLLVAHLGRTRISSMHDLGELLAHNGIRPVGVALLGVERQHESGYYTDVGPRKPLRRHASKLSAAIG